MVTIVTPGRSSSLNAEAILRSMRVRHEQSDIAYRYLRGWWNEEAKGPKFTAIRRIYDLERQAIDAGEYDPYVVDWRKLFTPIEEAVWSSIRFFGLRAYPQLPVGRFFVDFGDPWRKIAIECDGRAYHVNKVADARRDLELMDLGWTVERIPGWICVLPDDDPRSAFHIIRRLAGVSDESNE